MNESEHIELIAAYLDGVMSPDEKIAFESRVKAEPALAEEVETLRLLHEQSDSFFRKEALVEQISAQNQQRIIKPLWLRPGFQVAFSIAAGLALIAVIYPLFFAKEQLNHTTIFEQNFVPYDDSGLEVARGESQAQDLWQQASLSYQQQDYAEASQHFRTILRQDASNVTAQFYLANCLMATENSQQAISYLTLIVNRDDFLYGDQARWLLALALIQKNDIQNATLHLKYLEKGKDQIAIKAHTLLENIKKLPPQRH
ncbi:MAG: tetratricopeptide repeat protein [Bacteroidia bacterium]